jgi:hypothetical protein
MMTYGKFALQQHATPHATMTKSCCWVRPAESCVVSQYDCAHPVKPQKKVAAGKSMLRALQHVLAAAHWSSNSVVQPGPAHALGPKPPRRAATVHAPQAAEGVVSATGLPQSGWPAQRGSSSDELPLLGELLCWQHTRRRMINLLVCRSLVQRTG